MAIRTDSEGFGQRGAPAAQCPRKHRTHPPPILGGEIVHPAARLNRPARSLPLKISALKSQRALRSSLAANDATTGADEFPIVSVCQISDHVPILRGREVVARIWSSAASTETVPILRLFHRKRLRRASSRFQSTGVNDAPSRGTFDKRPSSFTTLAIRVSLPVLVAGEGQRGRETRTYAPARPDQRSRNRDQSHA